ncbi:MAG: hypothetical protein U0Q15_15160 [Kineosporiaceae bacterium]
MRAATPEQLRFFLDRSLGGRQVPALLKAAGLDVLTLADVYGVPADEDVADAEWLEKAGRSGWVVLMKDERIRYRTAERAALVDGDVRAFCLTSGNLRAAQMAEAFLDNLAGIRKACQESGPFLYAVSARGLRRLDLS